MSVTQARLTGAVQLTHLLPGGGEAGSSELPTREGGSQHWTAKIMVAAEGATADHQSDCPPYRGLLPTLREDSWWPGGTLGLQQGGTRNTDGKWKLWILVLT